MAEEKHGRTLFVRNIPYSSTNDTLEKVFSDVGPIKSCFVVKDKESGKCRGFGYVKYTLIEDAEKAFKTVKKIDGRNVHIVYANKKEKKKKFGQSQNAEKEESASANVQETTHKGSKEFKKQKKVHVPLKGQKQAPNPLNEGKRARLIIRNLAFRCTKEEIQKAFGKHGDVVDVHIPKKECGTRLGFGFVQFKNRAQAGMAVKEINGKQICGRVVAVDWALPKDKFESKLAAKEDVDIKEETADDENMEVDDDDHDEESDDDEKVIINQNSGEKDRFEDSSSSEEEESSDDNDDESSGEDNDEDDKDSSDENDTDVENEASNKHRLQPAERESDVNEGRTVFIRNLPYAIENEELEEFFLQFGAVKYARIVVDRVSGMSKGSAFVQFQSKEATDSCVDRASKGEESDLSLGGRNLLVSLAVNKQQAGEFSQKDKKKEQKDTRNLYLAREGMIRPGTDVAKDVPAVDLAKRLKIDAAKRMKLKDQNVFVSSTRLCVHNIPTIVTDQQLKAVIAKAAGVKESQVVECRIMRDLDRVNSQGIGKSRGYAFCAFTKHEHALCALKNLNNNPDIFGNNKRLIVEFSLESRKALEAKQKRLEKSRAKLKQKAKDYQNSNASADETVNKRKRKYKTKGGNKPLENKKEQDKVARSLHKGPLGLPSHSGPKQRHKARPSQLGKDRNKGNNLNLRNNSMAGKFQQQIKQKSPKERPMKMKNSNKRRNDTDSFDKLVAAHKQKILSSANF